MLSWSVCCVTDHASVKQLIGSCLWLFWFVVYRMFLKCQAVDGKYIFFWAVQFRKLCRCTLAACGWLLVSRAYEMSSLYPSTWNNIKVSFVVTSDCVNHFFIFMSLFRTSHVIVI